MINIINRSIFKRSQWKTITINPSKIPEGQNFGFFVEKDKILWPAVLGTKHSNQVQNLHIFCRDFAAGKEVQGELIPLKSPIHSTWIATPWVSDNYLELLPTFKLGLYDKDRKIQVFESTWDLSKLKLIEDTEAVKVVEAYGTLKTEQQTLHIYGWMSVYSNQDVVPFEFLIVNSDQTVPFMEQKIDGLVMEIRDYPHIPFGNSRGMSTPIAANGKHTVSIAHDFILGDAMALPIAGSLLCLPPSMAPIGSQPVAMAALIATKDDTNFRINNLMAELNAPIYGMSDWTGVWGPSKKIAAAIINREAVIADHEGFLWMLKQQGSIEDAPPLGLAKRPGQTGGQQEFGVEKGSQAVAVMCPHFIAELYYSAMQEALRPGHFRNPDGSIVVAANMTPRLVYWSGRPHWHPEQSPNRLGKPLVDGFGSPEYESYGWKTKDNQHWSMNTLAAAFILTGSNLLKTLIQDEIELFLGGLTIDPNLTTTNPDSPRGMGRYSDAACWMHYCTGDERIYKRLEQRYTHSLEWITKTPEFSTEMGSLEITQEPNYLNGIPSITVWNTALGITGLYRTGVYLNHMGYVKLAMKAARTILKYGITKQNGNWIFWDNIAYDAAGLKAEDYTKIGEKVFTSGWFTDWVIGVAYVYAKAKEAFPELVEDDLYDKAIAIITESPMINTWDAAQWRAY
jgi:hypothetical protein